MALYAHYTSRIGSPAGVKAGAIFLMRECSATISLQQIEKL